jgi:hypothetical protein
MARGSEVRIDFVPDVDRTVRALRVLERLATDLGEAYRVAATDLEALAPDGED